MKLKTTSIAALVLCTVAMSAGAQTPSGVPTNTCKKPETDVPIQGTAEQLARGQKLVDAYKACVNDYVKDVNEKARALALTLQSYTDASNKAIDDYNAFVAERNKRVAERAN
jgi:hypothetical protein